MQMGKCKTLSHKWKDGCQQHPILVDAQRETPTQKHSCARMRGIAPVHVNHTSQICAHVKNENNIGIATDRRVFGAISPGKSVIGTQPPMKHETRNIPVQNPLQASMRMAMHVQKIIKHNAQFL